MKLSLSLLLFTTTALAAVNRTLTNGWGSTPKQRHYIDADQAMAVIQGGIKNSV